jgi:hypothetical protein
VSDQEVRLRAIVDWLEHGRITTAQAAARIRSMRFPVPEDQTVHAQQYADLNGDPHVPEPGSFFVISDAFAAGEIDEAQYTALAQAAAEAMKAVSGASADHAEGRQ